MSFKLEHNTNEVVLKIGAYSKALEPRIDNAANEFINRVNRDAKINAPEAETTLTNSIKVRRLGVADYESKPEVGYGINVEKGTKKGGVPPVQSMIDWIKVRRIRPYTKDWTIKDLAFAIQQRIKKYGTKAQPFMKPALDQNKPNLDAILKRHLAVV